MTFPRLVCQNPDHWVDGVCNCVDCREYWAGTLHTCRPGNVGYRQGVDCEPCKDVYAAYAHVQMTRRDLTVLEQNILDYNALGRDR